MNQLQTVIDALQKHARYAGPKTVEAIAIINLMMQAEPVAWLVEFENGEQELHFNDTKESLGESQTPLYAAPQTVPAWLPIESAPIGLEMFIVRGFDVRVSDHVTKYTTDAYAVWQPILGRFERWPHPFEPTHWMPLPAAPKD